MVTSNVLTILKNAKLYNETFENPIITNIVVKGKNILYIGQDIANYFLDYETNVIDLSGKLVLLPFCDHHLHLPGTKIYDLHGLNVAECEDGEGYRELLINESKKDHIKLFRAFGWEVAVLKTFFDKVDYTPLQCIDYLFSNKPAVIFSEDLHSCWCNTIAMNYLKERNIECGFRDSEIKGGSECIFHERVVDLITSIEKLTFTYEEVRNAMLSVQEDYLKLGIGQVNTMMFTGVTSNHGLRVLTDMNSRRELVVNVNCCIDVYPEYSIQEIKNQLIYRKRYTSKKIKFGCFKIFIDGVIDNHSAALYESYSDQENSYGSLCFSDDKLREVVALAYEYDMPIHAHVIGDKAADQIVNILSEFPIRHKNRHMLTHLQVCRDETVKKMAELDIVACLQPFWFERGCNALDIDKLRLGDRVNNQYKAKSFLDNGVTLIFASDSPITPDYNPILGMKQAIKKDESNESISLVDAYKAYNMKSYYDGRFALKKGDKASFIVLNKDFFKDGLDGAEVLMTFIDGNLMYQK